MSKQQQGNPFTADNNKGSHRAWMLTINNPKILLVDYLTQWLADGNIVFGTGQTEKGASGTIHHQVYIVTKPNPKNKNGWTRKWVSENIHNKAWIAYRRGTHQQAVDYVNKPDTRVSGPWTIGEWEELLHASRVAASKKGGEATKKKITDLIERVKEGATDIQLLEEYPGFAFMHGKNIERVRLTLAQDVPRVQPYVVVLHGPTGTGKSHRANKIMEANGGGYTFRKGNSGNMWADGYDPLRHPCVWFDEMDGAFMPYRQLLRVCDKWPLVLDTKFGAVNFNPKVIIFTSSKHPKNWYSVEAVPDTTEMMRRLTGAYGCIIEMKEAFIVPKDAKPDLIDLINLLETGELVAQLSQVEALKSNNVINLADDDDDVDDKIPSQQCDDCGMFNCICDATDTQELVEDDVICLVCGAPETVGCDCTMALDDQDTRKQAKPAFVDLRDEPLPARLQRTDSTTFGLVRPPRASDEEFRKVKQIPGQTKLSIIAGTKRPREDE